MSTPAPPTNVTPTVDSNDQITLTWDYDPTWFAFDGDDGSLGGFDEGVWYSSDSVDSFEIQFSRDGIGYKNPSEGPSSVTYDESTSYSESYGPNSDNAYGTQVGIDSMFKFRVRAVNADGASDWTSSGTVYTEPIPPHNPSVSRPDANTFEISWTNQSDTAELTKVRVKEDTGSGYGSWDNFRNTNISNNSFTISVGDESNWGNITIQEDARYKFRLVHQNPDANFGYQSEPVYADYGNSGNVYFSDDFESGDASAWDSNNLAGDAGVQSVAGDADLTISGADEGTYYFYGEGTNSTEGTWLQKDLGDLSNETDVLVKCAFATASLDNSTEDFGISWYDGSSWQSLKHFGAEYNRQGWYEVSALVPASYLSTNNQIRVGTTTDDGMYSGDHFAIDRVVVSDVLDEVTTPAAPSNLALDTSTEGEITATWTENASLGGEVGSHSKAWVDLDGNRQGTIFGSGSNFSPADDGELYDFEAVHLYEQNRHGEHESWQTSSSITDSAITILPKPANPNLTATSYTSLEGTWDDVSNNEDGYYISQRGPSGNWEERAKLEPEYALDLDGTKVPFATQPVLEATGGTFLVEFELDSLSSGIVGLTDGGYNKQIEIDSNGNFTCETDVNGNSFEPSGFSGISTGTRYWFAVRFDNREADWIINGDHYPVTNYGTNHNTNESRTEIDAPLTSQALGGYAYENPMDGQFFRATWYSRALTNDEITHWSEGGTPNNPQADFELDEGSGSDITDSVSGETSTTSDSSSTSWSGPFTPEPGFTLTGLSQDTEYDFRVDNYTEHTTSQSAVVSASTFLNETRGTSTYSSSGGTSSLRVVDLLEGVISHAGSGGSSTSRMVDLNAAPFSRSNPMDSATSRGALALEQRDSEASELIYAGSSSAAVIDLLVGVESHANSSDSKTSRIVSLKASSQSHSGTFDSSALRVVQLLGNVSSHFSAASSTVSSLIDMLAAPESGLATSDSTSDRSGLMYAGRRGASSVPAIDSESIRVIDLLESVESHGKHGSSFAYNERTSLELIDHNIIWDNDSSVWYTDWFSETKILGNEDNLAIRSLVVPGSKEPAAKVKLQYDRDGDGEVDVESETIALGRDQKIHEVPDVPIDEDGFYRIKITEYSGYNSLTALDTAIVH